MNVRDIAGIAFGLRGHGTMLTLKAVFDGSGKENDHPVITVAGFFAENSLCEAIESEWNKATGGKVFHYRTFHTKYCALGSLGWTDEQRTSFLKRLGGIVNRDGVEIISHSVEVSEYRVYLSATKYAEVFGPAYSALALLCGYATELLLGERGQIMEKVAYIFEQGERAHELLKFFMDIESKRGKKFCGLRSHHFLSKDCVLLQASDLIAGTVQKLLLRATGAIPCLDNGRAFTPINNFEHYYSYDGVTASVIPPRAVSWRSVVNKPAFAKMDAVTYEAVTKHPDILNSRSKAKTKQRKRKKP